MEKGNFTFCFGAYLGYSQFHNRRSCRAKYSLFNGDKSFYFRFQKESGYTEIFSTEWKKGQSQ